MPEATINGVKVEIDAPYEAGRTIDADEARTLNQTRRENIRNNMAAKVKELLGETPVESLSQEVKDAIQAEITKYASTYTFASARGTGVARETDPFAKACRAIARQQLIAKLKEAGRSTDLKEYKSPTGQDAEAKIAELMSNPVIQKAARARVAAQEKEAAALKGLDTGDTGEAVLETTEG